MSEISAELSGWGGAREDMCVCVRGLDGAVRVDLDQRRERHGGEKSSVLARPRQSGDLFLPFFSFFSFFLSCSPPLPLLFLLVPSRCPPARRWRGWSLTPAVVPPPRLSWSWDAGVPGGVGVGGLVVPAGGCLEEDSVQLESRSHYTRLCSPLREREKGRKEGEGAHFFLLSSPMSLPLNQGREKALSPLPLSQRPGAAFSLSLPLFPFLYLPVLHLQAVCFGSSPGSTTQSFSSLSHTCTHSLQALYVFWSNLLLSPPPPPRSS